MKHKMVYWVLGLPILLTLACGGATAPTGDAGGTGETAVSPPSCEDIWQRPDGKETFYEPNPTYTDPTPEYAIRWARPKQPASPG
ncbi:MAG: hypothetical protein D6706_12120 [Chloroflexi bacterium]|nr:MAG: hypothetical protein D6706_12120 [Chloroflexota bacterium]